jgi:hypothetical protein
MNINDLNINVWQHLDGNGDIVSGYEALFLTKGSDSKKSGTLIFKDENKKLHFVIADSEVRKEDLFNPNVKGLSINLKKFKFRGREIEQFIDIEIGSNIYIGEFTQIVKEISEEVLTKDIKPMAAVKTVVNAWKSFWGNQASEILSEEKQVGLICELKVLKKLCEVDAELALQSWKGPLHEKYDFLFSEWAFEIKGTQRDGHIHIINGIDQLNPPHGKSLAFISFLVTKSANTNSKSLEEWISDFENKIFKDRIDLLDRFRKLILLYGYNRTYSEDYGNVKYDIYDGNVYLVNNNFPKLTSESLKESLDRRISELRYIISLNDLPGESFEDILVKKFYY